MRAVRRGTGGRGGLRVRGLGTPSSGRVFFFFWVCLFCTLLLFGSTCIYYLDFIYRISIFCLYVAYFIWRLRLIKMRDCLRKNFKKKHSFCIIRKFISEVTPHEVFSEVNLRRHPP